MSEQIPAPAPYSVIKLTSGDTVIVRGRPERIADDLVEAGYSRRLMRDGDPIVLMSGHVVYIEPAPETP